MNPSNRETSNEQEERSKLCEHLDVDNEETAEDVEVLNRYLAEAATIPLLTVAQEATLYDQVQRGLAANRQLEQDPALAEAPLLRAQISAGAAAEQQLYRANARVVLSIVKRYVERGLDITTLMTYGNQGVLRAIEDRRSYSGFYESKRFHEIIRQAVNEAARRQRLP